MCKVNGRYFWILVIKFTITLLCCGFFIYFSLDVWKKISHNFTTTSVRFIDQELDIKYLPCFTLCPWSAFKKNGFHYDFTDFMNSTFDKDDLIFNTSLFDSDVQSLQIKTLNSIFQGRCYMMCHSVGMTKNDFIIIFLKKTTLRIKKYKKYSLGVWL